MTTEEDDERVTIDQMTDEYEVTQESLDRAVWWAIAIVLAVGIALAAWMLAQPDAEAAAPDETIPAPPVCIPVCVGISEPAVATRGAVRVGNAMQLTEPPAPDLHEINAPYDQLGYNPDGLRGLPFYPGPVTGRGWSDDDRCAEMEWYNRQGGLPLRFDGYGRTSVHSRNDGVGWGESKCHNNPPGDNANSSSDCCLGYFQMHSGNIRGTLYEPYLREHCQITSKWDYFGDTPLAKQKQVCFAKVVFDISGLRQPWDRSCNGLC